jgi:hypothetical protein
LNITLKTVVKILHDKNTTGDQIASNLKLLSEERRGLPMMAQLVLRIFQYRSRDGHYCAPGSFSLQHLKARCPARRLV